MRILLAGVLLAQLCIQQAAAADVVEGVLVSTHPIDWEFADGRATEAFLVMDDGREVRFAHERVTELQPGERLRMHLSGRGMQERRIPVICTLERLDAGGTVWQSTRGNLCTAGKRQR
ncbi:hypothetical protein Tgr7_0493 [Thioalkalivibrio sulfidiphilus HL-EbGr7]|uniref:Secreted protein n=1 Tax=Thioalkalivibrio sulfidiphilus (strain HL-EbGR7) TaxID=396588 RepID=B8GL72_THISH|nr:hypothetical protein [Thioalkalivibrio sulfidiphilus]ACL71590.1 hypothetical protein Tgr7_0493 [Thioalkalivibrio sulfidiphilus HL-EbGr7]